MCFVQLSQSNQSEFEQGPQTTASSGNRDRKVTETSSDGEANLPSSQNNNHSEMASGEKQREGPSNAASVTNGGTSNENQAPKKAYEPTRHCYLIIKLVFSKKNLRLLGKIKEKKVSSSVQLQPCNF